MDGQRDDPLHEARERRGMNGLLLDKNTVLLYFGGAVNRLPNHYAGDGVGRLSNLTCGVMK